MLIWLRWALAGSVTIALLAALCRGWWRRVPVFCFYLAAQLPLLIGYQPESREWLTGLWVPLEPLVVLLRVGTALEAFPMHHPEDRKLAGISLAALALALAAVVWRTLSVDPQSMIVELRRYAQIFAGLFLLLYVIVAYFEHILKSGWKSRHIIILMMILMNHTVVSTISLRRRWVSDWWFVSSISFAVATAGYLIWTICCPLRPDKDDVLAQSREPL
jgi:hypothetical protein